MTESTEALGFAFRKLVEALHKTGAVDARAVAREIERDQDAPADIAGELTSLATDIRKLAGDAEASLNGYSPAPWGYTFDLIVQYLIIKESSFDRLDFAGYLDLCLMGMENHSAPDHLLRAVRDLADYSRGTRHLDPILRTSLSDRPCGTSDDESP